MSKLKLAELQAKLKTAKTKTGKAVIEKKIAALKSSMESTLSSAKKKVTGDISKLKEKPEFKFLKKMTKGQIELDQKRTAKPSGWRFKGKGKYRKPTKSEVAEGKKKGKVYYEARRRRSDVSRIVKLEKGGTMGEKHRTEE